jgi:hypothetical protein
MQSRRHFLATLALAPFAATDAALAADWPQRPVRIIYPYAAGGTGDATARLIAARLGEVFGQAFIVENRPGANGIVATETVARSPADGYTLLFAITPQIAIAPAMTKVPYDPVKDFAPIGTISSNRFALAVNPKVPVRTVAELLDYVRAQPKGFTYAEGGTGSISHLAMVLLLNRAGLSGTKRHKCQLQELRTGTARRDRRPTARLFCRIHRCVAACAKRCRSHDCRVECAALAVGARRADRRRVWFFGIPGNVVVGLDGAGRNAAVDRGAHCNGSCPR